MLLAIALVLSSISGFDAMQIMKISFIIFFIAFIFAPAIQYLHPLVTAKSVNENRVKVEWPQKSLWVGVRDGNGYSTQIESYFSDHFPLRDFMLRGQGQFEYSVLGRSREVIVGQEGWLSDKKVLAETLHNLDRVNDDKINLAMIQLKRFQYWLKQRDIDFLMVIVPMKPSVYAEKFPARYTHRPAVTGLMRFQQALAKNNIPYIDLLDILKRHKNEASLYYKTDMHWNTVGVNYAAEAIVNYFSQKSLGRPIWDEALLKDHQVFSGGELTTLPLFLDRHEVTPIWTPLKTGYKTWMQEGGPSSIEVYAGTDKKRAVLPPAIMFGNSFMLAYPSVGYHDYFSKSSRVLDYAYFSKVLDYIKPEHKIFVLHIYENQLLIHILPREAVAGHGTYVWDDYWDKRIKDLPLPDGYKYKSVT
jgi:hypothetical protein